ncbi:MAG: hypothetical protein ACOC1K_00060 [Nanoarchaeota archaeon]
MNDDNNFSFRNVSDANIKKIYKSIDKMNIKLSSKDKAKLLVYLKNTGKILKVYNEDENTLVILKFKKIFSGVKIPMFFTYDIDTEELLTCELLDFKKYYNSEFEGF